jgi:5'-nucleotidase
MKHGYTAVIDLDGVMSDFSRKVAELMKIAPQESLDLMERVDEKTIDKKRMWRYINEFDAHTPFFYSLEKMRDADELFSFITDHFDHDNIFFLTASGYTPSDAAHQKRRWVRKHYGSYKIEVVEKSHDKAKFATPNTILIDDREKSIKPWVEAGGIGILHKDAASTIAQLRKILEV